MKAKLKLIENLKSTVKVTVPAILLAEDVDAPSFECVLEERCGGDGACREETWQQC